MECAGHFATVSEHSRILLQNIAHFVYVRRINKTKMCLRQSPSLPALFPPREASTTGPTRPPQTCRASSAQSSEPVPTSHIIRTSSREILQLFKRIGLVHCNGGLSCIEGHTRSPLFKNVVLIWQLSILYNPHLLVST